MEAAIFLGLMYETLRLKTQYGYHTFSHQRRTIAYIDYIMNKVIVPEILLE